MSPSITSIEEPELRTPTPRRLTPHREAWNDWGNVSFALAFWGASLIVGAAGFLAATVSMSLAYGLWVFSGLLLLFTLLVTLGVIYCLTRDALFVRSGLAATATVLRSETVVITYGKSYRCDLDHRFTTADGEEIEDQWRGVDVPLQKSQPGDRVTVLYFPRSPKKNLAYCCALFRAR